MTARMLAIGGLLIAAQAGAQQEVYKWVDANGSVTYSETPPPGGASSEAVDLLPAPTPADVEAAQQRVQTAQDLSDQMGKERAERATEMELQHRAAVEQSGQQQTDEPPLDGGNHGGFGWWPYTPTYAPSYQPDYRPWPPPPPPPDNKSGSMGRLIPLPPRRAESP